MTRTQCRSRSARCVAASCILVGTAFTTLAAQEEPGEGTAGPVWSDFDCRFTSCADKAQTGSDGRPTGCERNWILGAGNDTCEGFCRICNSGETIPMCVYSPGADCDTTGQNATCGRINYYHCGGL